MRTKRKAPTTTDNATEGPPTKKVQSTVEQMKSSPGSRYNTRGIRIKLPGILTGRYDDDEDGPKRSHSNNKTPAKVRGSLRKSPNKNSASPSGPRGRGRPAKVAKGQAQGHPETKAKKGQGNKTLSKGSPSSSTPASGVKVASAGIFSRTIASLKSKSPPSSKLRTTEGSKGNTILVKRKPCKETASAKKVDNLTSEAGTSKITVTSSGPNKKGNEIKSPEKTSHNETKKIKSVVQEIINLTSAGVSSNVQSVVKNSKTVQIVQHPKPDLSLSPGLPVDINLTDPEREEMIKQGKEEVHADDQMIHATSQNHASDALRVSGETVSSNKISRLDTAVSLPDLEEVDEDDELFEFGTVTVRSSFAQRLSLESMVSIVQETGVHLVSKKTGQLLMEGKWSHIRKACLKCRQLKQKMQLGLSDSQESNIKETGQFEDDISAMEDGAGWSIQQSKGETDEEGDNYVSVQDEDNELSDSEDYNGKKEEKPVTQQCRTSPMARVNANQTMEELLSELEVAKKFGSETLFCCHQCKDFSAPLPKLKAHYYARHNFPCSKCGKLFFSSKSLHSHKCSSDEAFTSETQSPGCKDQQKMMAALANTELSDNKQPVSALWCPKCEKLCDTVAERRRHIIAVQKGLLDPFTCSECSFATFKCILFKKHQEIHSMFPSTIPIKQVRVIHMAAGDDEKPGEYSVEVEEPSVSEKSPYCEPKSPCEKEPETGSLKLEVEVINSAKNDGDDESCSVKEDFCKPDKHEDLPLVTETKDANNLSSEQSLVSSVAPTTAVIIKKWKKKDTSGVKAYYSSLVECEICGSLATNKLNMMEHQYKYHNAFKFQCHLCEGHVADIEKLNVHYNKHIDSQFKGDPKPIHDWPEDMCRDMDNRKFKSLGRSAKKQKSDATVIESDEMNDKGDNMKIMSKKGKRNVMKKMDLWCDKCQTECESRWDKIKHQQSNRKNKSVHMKWKCKECGYLTISCVQHKAHLEMHRKYSNVAPLIYVRVKHVAIEVPPENSDKPSEEDQVDKTEDGIGDEGLADGLVATKCENVDIVDENEEVELPEGQSIEDVDIKGITDTFMKKWKKVRHWNRNKYKDPSLLTHECNICGLLVPTSKYLHNHKRSVHPAWMFKCSLCDRLYDRTGSLNKHYNQHFTEMYQCHKCIRQFKLLTNFMHHMKSHDGSHAGTDDEIMSRCVIPASESEQLKDKLEKLLGEQEERDQKAASDGNVTETLNLTEEQNMGLHELKWRGLPDDMIMTCSQCPFKATKKDIITHRKAYHPKYMYKCDLCSREIREPRVFLKHYQMHFDEDGNVKPMSWRVGYEYSKHKFADYKCEKCCRTFFRSVDLRHHSKVHDKPEKFECPHCPLVSTSKYNFMDHMARKHGEDQHKCPQCPKTYSLLKDLNYHVDTEHLQKKKAKCEVCGQEFKNKRYVARHMLRHQGNKRFFCNQCGRGFYESLRLRMHMETHKPLSERQPKFRCTYCGKGFSSKFVCKEHENLHTGEKPYACEKCNSTFASYNSLRRHKMIHNDVRPYVCSEPNCTKAFAQKNKLTAHLVTHTLQSKYKCHVCGKCYTCGSTLRKHVCRGQIPSNQVNPGEIVAQQLNLAGSLTHPDPGTAIEVQNAVSAMVTGAGEIPVGNFILEAPPVSSTDGSLPNPSRELYMCSICDHIFHTWEEIQLHMLGHSIEGVSSQQETVEVDPQSLHFTIVDGSLQNVETQASELLVTKDSDEIIAEGGVDITAAATTLAEFGLSLPVSQ